MRPDPKKQALLDRFTDTFGSRPARCFRTPGRIEIGGNHTDHQGGRVLAAAIDRATYAAAAVSARPEIHVVSENLAEPITVALDDLEPRPERHGEASELVRGIAAAFFQQGLEIGGFDAYVSGDVPIGLGLSSSASFEVLVATIVSHLFNGGEIPELTLARIGQAAETLYFGKPCGLMDQIACAVGGIVTIDFEDPEEPRVRPVDFDFARHGLDLLVVDTGSGHADLSHEYAAIPDEMARVARALGFVRCREVPRQEIEEGLLKLRPRVGDRAVLRALHFLAEDERVSQQVEALERGDVKRFLELVRASGDSSWKWLQNCYVPGAAAEQGIALALALSEQFLDGCEESACRVLGGGFAGAVEVFLPRELTDDYSTWLRRIFDTVTILRVAISDTGSLEDSRS